MLEWATDGILISPALSVSFDAEEGTMVSLLMWPCLPFGMVFSWQYDLLEEVGHELTAS